MEFDIPKDKSSIIKVIGVGGGGSNAVNHMYNQGIAGVDFIVCNTDRQALDRSPVPHRIQLGPNLTDGRGAGMQPEVGMNAALENIEEIKSLLSDETKMVFITAGMGGGTGTGAAPVIAQVAKELGILTVGIVTVPFNFEGKRRRQQAENGLESMRENVDTLLIINNERLKEFGKNMALSQAFGCADNILTVAAKGIAEVISVTGIINVDFNDVNTVLKNSGRAIMGSAIGEGENRATDAVQNALISPLLNDNDIHGAQYILLNITYGEKEVMMDEISEITDYIQDAAGATADVIWGHGYDASLGDKLSITLIATGFTADAAPITGFEKTPKRVEIQLNEDMDSLKEITTPLSEPITESSYLVQEEEVIEKTETTEAENKESIVEIKNTQVKSDKSECAQDLKEDQVTIHLLDSIDDEVEEELHTENEESSIELKSESTQEELTWELEIVDQEEISKADDALEEKSMKEEVVRHILEDDTLPMNTEESKPSMSSNDFQQKTQERYSMLEQFTSNLKKADKIEEFENEPAFQRRNIQIDETKPSEQENVSRFGLSDDGNGKANLKNNNFLHDNVD